MKRIYKIFMAVAAVAAVGCTTDATEDLGVSLNGGPTTLTLSLDDTRTQLGEKADGTYPLTWAENDAISVNGSVSNALTADEAGAATATFTFENGFGSAPYFVAYPAVEGTANQVVFAAEQTHTSNTTFGNGATVMYGYANDLSSIKLNHLAGILKIGVVSGTEGPAFIKEVRISTVDRKPIAGAFNVDAEGKLTATEGATEVITYKAESDTGFLALPVAETNPVTYIYVAVPAGVYGELYVTLESADGVMYKTIKTDSTKPLNAGNVREFSNNIAFVPVAKTETFVIASYSDLWEYKEAVEGGSTLDAVLVNDVECPMAGDFQFPAWESIDAPNYDGTIYGNGYSIKKLNAPLFNQTSASFKGLHLVVNVTETVNPNFGAFARKLIANGKPPKIEHCSVSGSITINTDVTPAKADVLGDGAVGGFVGTASYVQFDNCVNNASITVSQMSSSTEMHATIGGLMGYTYADESEYTQFKDCANRGEITVNDTTGKLNLRVGGFIGCQRETKSTILFDHCQSEGDISIGESASYRLAYIAGFVADGYVDGSANATTFNFNNETLVSSDLTVKGSASNVVRVGSFVGYQNCSTININGETVINGAIDINVTASANSQIGGLVGYMGSAAKINIHNYVERTENATINIEGSYQNTKTCYVGGLTGHSESSSNYINIYEKTFSNSGKITLGKVTTSGNTAVGGVAGWMNYGYILFGNGKIINSGTITVTKDAITNGSLFVGGLVGSMINNSAKFGTISNTEGKGEAVNTGDIIFEGTANSKLNIGGFLGVYNKSTSLGENIPKINTGNIKATGVFKSQTTYNKDNYVGVGGFVGYHNTETSTDTKAYKNVQCYCKIEAYTVTKNGDEYQFTPYPRVGLLTGSQLPNKDDSSSNISVGGDIATTATVVDGEVKPTWENAKTNYNDYILGVRGLTGFSTVNWLESENEITWVNFGN